MRPGKKRRESEAAATNRKREQTRRPESRRETKPNADAVAGRNPVLEALRAKVPAKELLIAERTEIDERMSESMRLAKNQNLAIKEVPRGSLDGLTGTTTHQGIALVILPFKYASFDRTIAPRLCGSVTPSKPMRSPGVFAFASSSSKLAYLNGKMTSAIPW